MVKFKKDKPHGHEPNDSEIEGEQWFLGFHEKGVDVLLKDVRVVVENIGDQHENVEFGFRIKELQKDEKEMLKNMSAIGKWDKRLPCLGKVEKGKLFTEVKKVNEFLTKIE